MSIQFFDYLEVSMCEKLGLESVFDSNSWVSLGQEPNLVFGL